MDNRFHATLVAFAFVGLLLPAPAAFAQSCEPVETCGNYVSQCNIGGNCGGAGGTCYSAVAGGGVCGGGGSCPLESDCESSAECPGARACVDTTNCCGVN